MGLPVCLIIILISVEIFRLVALSQRAGDDLRTVRTLQRIGFDNFSAIKSKDTLSLFAGISGQAKCDRVSASRAQHGVRDPGIATGRVKEDFSRIQLSAFFSRENYGQRGAIFYRTTRIQVLSFYQ